MGGILKHMNSDHADALSTILARLHGVEVEASMVAADPQGCHVRLG